MSNFTIPATKILPWEDCLIVIDAPEDVTDEGVVIGPVGEGERKKMPEKGIVVSVGKSSDPKASINQLLAGIKPGDMIFYERYTANKIPDNGVEYNFVRFKFIMGYKKLEKEGKDVA